MQAAGVRAPSPVRRSPPRVRHNPLEPIRPSRDPSNDTPRLKKLRPSLVAFRYVEVAVARGLGGSGGRALARDRSLPTLRDSKELRIHKGARGRALAPSHEPMKCERK